MSPPSSSSELTWFSRAVSTHKKKVSSKYAISNHSAEVAINVSLIESCGRKKKRAHLSLALSLLEENSSHFFSKLFSMDLRRQTGLRLSLNQDKMQTVFIAPWLKVNKQITCYYLAHHKYGRWRARRAPSALHERLPCEWEKGPSVSWHLFCPAEQHGCWRRCFYCSSVHVHTLRKLPADVQPIFREDPEYPAQRFCLCLGISGNYLVFNSQFKSNTEDTFPQWSNACRTSQ